MAIEGGDSFLTLEVEKSRQNGRVWGVWPTVGLGIAVFVAYLLAQAAVAFIFAVIKIVSNPDLSLSQLANDLSTNGLLIAVATLASTFVGLPLIVVFVKVRRGAPIAEYLGLRRITGKTIFILLAIVAGMVVLSGGLNMLGGGSDNAAFAIDTYRTSVWPALLWISFVIVAPAFEETFFRGFLFVGFRQSRLGAIGAIGLTALFWALLHIQYDIYGMATIFVMGIVLGIVRLKTGSLWSPLLMHSVWNLVGMVGTALYVSGAVS
jgi:membrane protease YdiL (CAAX protease family)